MERKEEEREGNSRQDSVEKHSEGEGLALEALFKASPTLAPLLPSVLEMNVLSTVTGGLLDAAWGEFVCSPHTPPLLVHEYTACSIGTVEWSAALPTSNAWRAAFAEALCSGLGGRDAYARACRELAGKLINDHPTEGAIDVAEALFTTADAAERGLLCRTGLRPPSNIATDEGRELALTEALERADLELREDSVLCEKFISGGAAALEGAPPEAQSSDERAIEWVVETMAELEWLHSTPGVPFQSLVRAHRAYPDRYTSNKVFASAIRNVKLAATRAFLAQHGSKRRKGVPPSLLKDLDALGDSEIRIVDGEERVERGGGRKRGGGCCWNCGEYGHFAAECDSECDYF